MTDTMTREPLFTPADESQATHVPPTNKPLTALERCDGVFKVHKERDSCLAASAVRAVMKREDGSYGELLFCGHCYDTHSEKLNEVAFRIDDQRVEPHNRLIGASY